MHKRRACALLRSASYQCHTYVSRERSIRANRGVANFIKEFHTLSLSKLDGQSGRHIASFAEEVLDSDELAEFTGFDESEEAVELHRVGEEFRERFTVGEQSDGNQLPGFDDEIDEFIGDIDEEGASLPIAEEGQSQRWASLRGSAASSGEPAFALGLDIPRLRLPSNVAAIGLNAVSESIRSTLREPPTRNFDAKGTGTGLADHHMLQDVDSLRERLFQSGLESTAIEALVSEYQRMVSKSQNFYTTSSEGSSPRVDSNFIAAKKKHAYKYLEYLPDRKAEGRSRHLQSLLEDLSSTQHGSKLRSNSVERMQSSVPSLFAQSEHETDALITKSFSPLRDSHPEGHSPIFTEQLMHELSIVKSIVQEMSELEELAAGDNPDSSETGSLKNTLYKQFKEGLSIFTRLDRVNSIDDVDKVSMLLFANFIGPSIMAKTVVDTMLKIQTTQGDSPSMSKGMVEVQNALDSIMLQKEKLEPGAWIEAGFETEKQIRQNFKEKSRKQLDLVLKNWFGGVPSQLLEQNWQGADGTDSPGSSLRAFLIDQERMLKMAGNAIEIAMSSCKLKVGDSMKPLFSHRLVIKGQYKKIGKIEMNSASRWAVDAGQLNVADAHLQPMLCLPRLWDSDLEGGYLATRTPLMRTKRDDQLEMIQLNRRDMYRVYAGLNALSQTPWQINHYAWNLINEIWRMGGNFSTIPPADDSPLAALEARDVDEQEYQNMASGLHSQRASFRLLMDSALPYVERRRFFLPHNLDFRGRAYPVPGILHHMGADTNRSILKYAYAKPLTNAGVTWLKIHIANLFGHTKATYLERVSWADNMMDRFFRWEHDPLGTIDEWGEADEPLQAMCAIKELVDAYNSGDPASFMSALPVHIDGSCNGLQHYAALGRDLTGGVQVNLLGLNRPADPYMGVANVVKARLEFEASQGSPEAQLILPLISRKVVKQTVMTSVYGVTAEGAREQIKNRFHELGDSSIEGNIDAVSGYLMERVMEALDELFSGARETMKWLGDVAELITSHSEESMSWQTPLGLPVVQPYRRVSSFNVSTAYQSVKFHDTSAQTAINRKKQASAFPPNYIHSIDSSHMLLCAARAHHSGIAFAGVHDSYWAHGCDIGNLHVMLREEFVRLHSLPLLEDLYRQIKVKYPHVKIPDLPRMGVLDLAHILKAPYFFS